MISLMRTESRIINIILFCLFFTLSSCGGGQVKKDDQIQQTDPPLAKTYENIIFIEFESAPELEKDYPHADGECKAGAVSALLAKKIFKMVATKEFKLDDLSNTLFVKANITEMRITSGAARFWAGAFAGSSYMNLDVHLIDAATGKEVRKKKISSTVNAMGAAWSGGASDRSLTYDMGNIIAEYIVSVVPRK